MRETALLLTEYEPSSEEVKNGEERIPDVEEKVWWAKVVLLVLN